MQRVYLLLRNNKQSGPYTLEELVQQGLNFLDLIWIEGKSTGWSYPVEIDVLKPYLTSIDLSNTAQPTIQSEEKPPFKEPSSAKPENAGEGRKKIFVSFPNQDYQPAATPKPVDDFRLEKIYPETSGDTSSINYTEQPTKNTETRYHRTLNDIEEEYTAWMYHQNRKKKKDFSKQKIALSVVVVAGFLLGYFIVKPLLSQDAASSNPVVKNPPAKEENINPESEPSESIQKITNPAQGIAYTTKTKQATTVAAKEKKQAAEQQKQETGAATVPDGETNEAKEPTDYSSDTPVSDTEERTEAPKEKKKTIGEKIDDFFGKFSKKEKPSEEESPVTTPDTKTGERKAKRRGDEASSETEATDITDLIDITSNATGENWMMGVQGLKLTLTNRSDKRIETALVEVRYYDEKNALLEKKTIQFHNVAPKKSQSVAAPDHRLADHVEHKLLSVQRKKTTGMKAF